MTIRLLLSLALAHDYRLITDCSGGRKYKFNPTYTVVQDQHFLVLVHFQVSKSWTDGWAQGLKP